MEIKQKIALDNVTFDGCFSIKKQNYIEINGQEINIGLPEYRTFCPGKFDELKEYAPECEPIAQAVWTMKVIATWEKKQTEQ